MVPPDDSKELDGIARSIDALFDEGGDTSSPASESVGETPAATPPPIPAPTGDGRHAADSQPEDQEAEEQDTEAQEAQESEAQEPVGILDETDASPASEDMVWESVEDEEPQRAYSAEDADPDALDLAVRAFLAAAPLSREGLGRAVRDAAGALREAAALDPLADAVEQLVQEAGDPPDVACTAMARTLLTPSVASRLVARLTSTHDEARRAELVEIASRLGHEMALALSDGLAATTDRHARRLMVEAMVAVGSEATPVVEAMAGDGRWFVVRNAAAVLGEVGGERAVELITATLAHTDARVRREGLLSLAKVGGDDAGLLVYGMLEDPDADVRLAAAMAAGALKVERALKPLLALLEGETDDDVVGGVLGALGQLGDPGAVPTIEKRAVGSFLSKPPTAVRIAAYRALHRIGTPHAKGLLVKAADDKDLEVKAVVRQLLGMR